MVEADSRYAQAGRWLRGGLAGRAARRPRVWFRPDPAGSQRISEGFSHKTPNFKFLSHLKTLSRTQLYAAA